MTADWARFEALPADVRALVHDEGWETIREFLDLGITDTQAIRRLIDMVRTGGDPRCLDGRSS